MKLVLEDHYNLETYSQTDQDKQNSKKVNTQIIKTRNVREDIIIEPVSIKGL